MPNKTRQQRRNRSTSPIDREFRHSILREQKGCPIVDAFVRLKNATPDESKSRSVASRLLGSEIERQVLDAELTEKLYEIGENHTADWLWIRVSIVDPTQQINVQELISGVMANIDDLLAGRDVIMCQLPELRSLVTLALTTTKQKQRIDKLTTLWQSDAKTTAKKSSPTQRKGKGLPSIEDWKKQASRFTPEQRAEIMEVFAKANEADYRRLLFGAKKPTLAGFKKYLRDHAGDKMENSDKVFVAKAINFFRRKFGTAFVFQNEDGKLVRCTLTTERNIAGDTEYQRRFRLSASGNNRATIYGRNAFPELFLEKI